MVSNPDRQRPAGSVIPSVLTPQVSASVLVMIGSPISSTIRYPFSVSTASNTPFFTDKNVTEFLTTYEEIYEDYGLSEAQYITRIPRYCIPLIRQYIKTLPDYEDKDWGKLKAAIIKEWESEDEE